MGFTNASFACTVAAAFRPPRAVTMRLEADCEVQPPEPLCVGVLYGALMGVRVARGRWYGSSALR